jgi:thioredoxin-related protein
MGGMELAAMNRSRGRLLPIVLTAASLVGAAACSVESPASTPTASAPATLFTHRTVESAWKKAERQRRPLVIMFTSDHCPHCERMLAKTYADPEIRRLLSTHAETVLAHSKDYAELIRKLGVRGYPTTLIVAADGNIADAVEGFVEPPAFAVRLAKWVGPGAAAAAQAATLQSR